MTSRDAGTARVIIPSDIDRDSYIRKCYDTGRVSLYTYGAGVIRDASVCLHCINDLVFPSTALEYGSPVLYIKTPNREEYTVYGVLKEIADVYNITEHQFSVGRKTDVGIVNMSGDADNGSMTITVNHNSKGGKLTINIGNSKAPSSLDINVSGKVNSISKEVNMSVYDRIMVTLPKGKTGGVTKFGYVKGSGFSYVDEFGNEEKIDSNSHTINHKKKLIFGTGDEKAVLGLKLVALLEKLIATVSTSTVLGSVPLDNGAVIAEISADLQGIISEYIDIQ